MILKYILSTNFFLKIYKLFRLIFYPNLFKFLFNGVLPSFDHEKTLRIINPIEEIENPKINYEIFNNLAYGQWTLKEIESGEAWEVISKNK